LLEIFSRKSCCNFSQRRKEEKGAEVEEIHFSQRRKEEKGAEVEAVSLRLFIKR